MTRFAERRLGTVALSGMLGLTAAVTLVTTITATPAYAQATSTVEAFLAEARGHLEASRFSQAARAYGEALRLDPNNTEAREGQRIANQLLNRGPVLPDQGQATDRDVIRQAIRVEVDDALNRSRDELRRNNFGAARTVAIEAKVRAQSASDLFSPSELSQMLDRADRLQADIDSAEESFRLDEAARAGQEARDNEADQIRRAQEQEQITINEKLIRVRQLQLEQKYEEARTVVEEILFIDQRNPAALALRDILESSALYQEYARIQNQKERSYLRGNIDMQDRLILPTRNLSGTGRKGLSEVVQYPDDWVKLSLGRTTTAGFVDTPQNRAVLGTLQSTPVQVAFDNNRFDQVVTYLETVSGLPIYVDWKSLDLDAGLDETAEVNLNIGEVPMNIAMDRIMDQLGEDDDTRPRYTVKDGILTIASDAALRKDTVMAVYDIKDLLFEIPQFDNAPDFDLDSAFGQGGGNGNGGGGGGGGFGGGGSGGGGGGRGGGGSGGGGSLFGGDIEEADRRTRQELIEQILGIIQEQVDPEGWVDNGGETGTVQELNGNLIITNTNGNHRAIEGLLSQLRDIRSLQINMEGRILSVSSDWFEKIGIDLDLYFNTNSDLRANQLAINPLGRLSDFFGPDGQLLDPLVYGGASQFPDADGDGSPDFVAPFNAINYGVGVSTPVDLDGDGIPEANSPFTAGLSTPLRTTQGFTPIGVNQQSLDLLDIVGATTAFGSSVAAAAPALATGFSFLDDIQVDLLVEATQADQRSVVLTAPRLTFHNGQRAFIAIQQEEAFISGLTPITSEGAVAFQPDVDTVNSGIVLDVEAVASADRRYVCATVSFNQAQFLEFREIPFTGGAGGGGLGGGQAGTAEATIQLPIVAGSQLRTSVCVPDKGTVLLGGQRTTEEIEVETGVPVLSKIPFINRFFTNRQTSKQETTLLILLRPELIIQQEQEDTLYPGLSDQLGIGSFR